MRNIFLLLAVTSIVFITVIGVPFTMNAGQINQIDNQFHFITPNRSISALVANAGAASIRCEGRNICITPSDRKSFKSNVPIKFEICESENGSDLHCNGSPVFLQLNTSRWLKAGLFR